MRRTDREVTDFNEIVGIISRCNTVRLGINSEEYPYVVPLSFGFEAVGEIITLYIHGAKEGLKHDLLAKDSRVCMETSIFHQFTEVPGRGITTEYESVIGFGRAETVEGDEAVKGLNLICEHAGYKGYPYGGAKALGFTRVYKITIEHYTGKKRFVRA